MPLVLSLIDAYNLEFNNTCSIKCLTFFMFMDVVLIIPLEFRVEDPPATR